MADYTSISPRHLTLKTSFKDLTLQSFEFSFECFERAVTDNKTTEVAEQVFEIQNTFIPSITTLLYRIANFIIGLVFAIPIIQSIAMFILISKDKEIVNQTILETPSVKQVCADRLTEKFCQNYSVSSEREAIVESVYEFLDNEYEDEIQNFIDETRYIHPDQVLDKIEALSRSSQFAIILDDPRIQVIYINAIIYKQYTQMVPDAHLYSSYDVGVLQNSHRRRNGERITFNRFDSEQIDRSVEKYLQYQKRVEYRKLIEDFFNAYKKGSCVYTDRTRERIGWPIGKQIFHTLEDINRIGHAFYCDYVSIIEHLSYYGTTPIAGDQLWPNLQITDIEQLKKILAYHHRYQDQIPEVLEYLNSPLSSRGLY